MNNNASGAHKPSEASTSGSATTPDQDACSAPADDADYLLASYDYELPEALIAQHPPEQRGLSRLLVLDRASGGLVHSRFADLCDHLPEGALLVVNNSKVLPARLLGFRPTGGKVEFLMLTPLPLVTPLAMKNASGIAGEAHPTASPWQVAEVEGLLRASKPLRPGDVLTFGEDIRVEVVRRGEFGRSSVLLHWRGELAALFARDGHLPLPPYIRRSDEADDRDRYQTVFAREDRLGSVAAPTAGLHFTPDLRERLAARGNQWAEVTLYVGYGTFSPVRCPDIRDHAMHREYVEITRETVEAIRRAKAEGRPIVAVGTTSARVLEGVAAKCGQLEAHEGWTDIFMYPGFSFKVVDQLITNFHLPESSLLMLVSAFAGRDRVFAAYAEAIKRGYRFFSYGDAMLLH